MKRSQQFDDSKDLGAMLFSISRGNPQRAASAISKMLDTNQIVKDNITHLVFKRSETVSKVMEGIRESIDLHTDGKGTRTMVAETFIKNIVTACMFKIVGLDNDLHVSGNMTQLISRLIAAGVQQ